MTCALRGGHSITTQAPQTGHLLTSCLRKYEYDPLPAIIASLVSTNTVLIRLGVLFIDQRGPSPAILYWGSSRSGPAIWDTCPHSPSPGTHGPTTSLDFTTRGEDTGASDIFPSPYLRSSCGQPAHAQGRVSSCGKPAHAQGRVSSCRQPMLREGGNHHLLFYGRKALLGQLLGEGRKAVQYRHC